MPPACGREHAPGVRCWWVAAMVATGMDVAGMLVGRRHGGDRIMPPAYGVGGSPPWWRRGWIVAPRRTVSSAPSFFTLVPASRIVEDILGPNVVFELIADDAVHESRIPKAHFFALDTLVYAPCDCCFE